MKKLLLLLLILLPINVFAISTEIESKSAIVVNRENNEILYEKNINEQLPIASLTKIMTTIVALENINSLNTKVTITTEDVNVGHDYVTVGLKEGMEVSYKDLLYSTILHSAADSAIALSNHTFASYQEFINKMNTLAKRLNMNNTNFSNPVGFDENNYSTANDLYKLLEYSLNNHNFYEIYTTQKYEMECMDKTINNYVNNAIEKNNIANNKVKFKGTKTGFTTLSGLSLSGITSVDNNELIVITIGGMGTQDTKLHLIDSTKLISDIKDLYSNRILIEKDTLIDNIVYKKGKKNLNYEIRSTDTIKYFMDNRINLNYLKIYYEGKTELDKNITIGEEIGNIKIYYENKLLKEEKVKFNKKNIIKENKDYTKIFIFIGICIIGLFIFRKKK